MRMVIIIIIYTHTHTLFSPSSILLLLTRVSCGRGVRAVPVDATIIASMSGSPALYTCIHLRSIQSLSSQR